MAGLAELRPEDEAPPRLESPHPAGSVAGAQVQLRTLVLIRWIAVAGQAASLIGVHYALGYALPILPALAVVACSIALNFAVVAWHGGNARLGDRHAALYLGFDIVQLSVLLFLTGGLNNPFELLVLAPVTVSATVLSRRSTVRLCLLAIACVTGLAVWHLPLPWDGPPPELPSTLVFAVWAATVLAIVFIAAYVSQVAMEARRMSDALAATQIALAREQRLSALGTLAAAAAHELGSPLATIAVVAREIARDLPPESPMAEDAELLLSQTARCREILTELARRPDADDQDPFLDLPLTNLVEEIVARHRRADIAVALRPHPAAGGPPEPVLARRPELVHGLGNLIGNAIQFALRRVEIDLEWDGDEVSVTILDDGPGFPPGLLGRLGEPYISGRPDDEDHMGLGIFIAVNLLERGGARLSFGNARPHGARVAVRWRRAILEERPGGRVGREMR